MRWVEPGRDGYDGVGGAGEALTNFTDSFDKNWQMMRNFAVL